jgi:hypothetical protein
VVGDAASSGVHPGLVLVPMVTRFEDLLLDGFDDVSECLDRILMRSMGFVERKNLFACCRGSVHMPIEEMVHSYP